MVIAYRVLADEMRALAKRANDPKSTEQFLKLADAYDELARGQGMASDSQTKTKDNPSEVVPQREGG
jgi:hypothetical protein